MSETSSLTGPIHDLLEARGILVFRMQSGKIKSRSGGWMKLCPKGTADLLFFSGRDVVWVETKAVEKEHHKEQREAQELFRMRVTALGHSYITARSIEDVLEILK
jgi:hypothetical protein